MQNKKCNGARMEPWDKPWAKWWMELKTLKSWTLALWSLKKEHNHQMNSRGMPASNIWSRRFSPQTISKVLMKSNSVSTERCIGHHCSHLLFLGLYKWPDLLTSNLYKTCIGIDWTNSLSQRCSKNNQQEFFPEI